MCAICTGAHIVTPAYVSLSRFWSLGSEGYALLFHWGDTSDTHAKLVQNKKCLVLCERLTKKDGPSRLISGNARSMPVARWENKSSSVCMPHEPTVARHVSTPRFKGEVLIQLLVWFRSEVGYPTFQAGRLVDEAQFILKAQVRVVLNCNRKHRMIS